MTDEDVGTPAGETCHAFSIIIIILLLYWEERGLLEYGYMCRPHSEQFENFLLCFCGHLLAYGFRLQKQGKMSITDRSREPVHPCLPCTAVWLRGRWKQMPPGCRAGRISHG